MKHKILFTLFIIINSSCFSQKQEVIEIKELFTPFKTYENDKLIKIDKRKESFSYLYKINSQKDSLLYYDISSNPINKVSPTIFVLKKRQKEKDLFLLIKDKEATDTLYVSLSDISKSIIINKSDTYFLNSDYYNEFKKNIYQKQNILDLADFLDDNMGDYPYQMNYLKRISSNKKYRNNNLKIIKAKLLTTRSQSDKKDNWVVIYKYNKNNILESVIKKLTEGDIGFEKKLLSKIGQEYSYKIHTNIESRYGDNDEINFNIDKNTYNAIQNHFQFGQVKEEISQLKRVFYKKNNVYPFFLIPL